MDGDDGRPGGNSASLSTERRAGGGAGHLSRQILTPRRSLVMPKAEGRSGATSLPILPNPNHAEALAPAGFAADPWFASRHRGTEAAFVASLAGGRSRG